MIDKLINNSHLYQKVTKMVTILVFSKVLKV